MSSRRQLKAASAVRQVVSMAILTELRDPRVSDVTVTHVEMSPDMREAKVYVSIMGDDTKQQISALRGLQSRLRISAIQNRAERIETRYTPRLQFIADLCVKRSLEVADILHRVLAEDKAADELGGNRMKRPERFRPARRTTRNRSSGNRLSRLRCHRRGRRSSRRGSIKICINRTRITPTTEPTSTEDESMANLNRTALLTKAHRVFKQHYKPVAVPHDRPLLEQMLYACCLENAPYEMADKIFEHLTKSFFDWNEVRVSTVTELSEAMHALPDAVSAAANVKRILQGVFESTYSFDMEAAQEAEHRARASRSWKNSSAALAFCRRLCDACRAGRPFDSVGSRRA